MEKKLYHREKKKEKKIAKITSNKKITLSSILSHTPKLPL